MSLGRGLGCGAAGRYAEPLSIVTPELPLCLRLLVNPVFPPEVKRVRLEERGQGGTIEG